MPKIVNVQGLNLRKSKFKSSIAEIQKLQGLKTTFTPAVLTSDLGFSNGHLWNFKETEKSWLNPTPPFLYYSKQLQPRTDTVSQSAKKMAKRLIPSLNRILVEKIVPPSRTNSGILLPEKTPKLNSGKVVAVGPGAHDKDGKLIPVAVKAGDTVLLPEYGGTEVKLGEKEYHLYRDEDILGTLHD